MIWLEGLADEALRSGHAGPLGVRRVAEHQVDAAALPISASRPTSVRRPSTGVWSSFQSPVWSTRPAGVSRTMDTASGTECATRMKLDPERTDLDRASLRVGLLQVDGVQ